jgi:DNA-binding NtrC family response regulator
MTGQILCIGGEAARWAHWSHELEDDGYVVVHANDEREALALLEACSVDVICIDSKNMTRSGGSGIAAGLKNAVQHVPVVLIKTGNDVPEHFEEHVDVVIDESTFSSMGQWLIEELREVRFPLFVEWFEAWKERSESTGEGEVHVC